jgi:FAD synthase
VAHVRPERKFSGLAELREQIDADVAEIRALVLS